MEGKVIERALGRLRGGGEGRSRAAATDAALERAGEQLEALVQTAAELETELPDRVAAAVQDGLREQVIPVARQLAEVRGLMNQVIRRLERLEGIELAERHARVDDLALLVELTATGWKSIDGRIAKIEQRLQTADGAVVYQFDEHRPPAADSV